jgi:PAS domain S-box-containing protein
MNAERYLLSNPSAHDELFGFVALLNHLNASMGPPSPQDMFGLFADHATDYAMLVLDPDGHIVYWSAGAEQLLGWAAEEVQGRHTELLFTPEDREAGVPTAEMEEARQQGRAAEIRWHVAKDGTRYFVDGVLNAWSAPGGSLLGYGKIFREAYVGFERRLNEVTTALLNEKNFLATVLERVEDAIVACDCDGALTFFNRASKEFHGVESAEVPPERWAAYFNLYRADGRTPLQPEEVPLMRALRGEYLRDVEIVVAVPGGKPRVTLVSGGPLLAADGDQLGAVVSMHDISAQREAERIRQNAVRDQARREEAEALAQRIRESEERVRLAADAAELGIWAWDMQTRQASWENDRMYEIFGVPKDDCTSAPTAFHTNIIWPDDVAVYKRTLAACLRSGKRFHFEGRFRRRGQDAPGWFELTGLLHRADDGRPLKIIGTAADITERKQAHAALTDAKARVESILAIGEIATWILDLRTRRVTADRNLAYLFGLSESEASNGSFDAYLDAVHPNDRERVISEIRGAIQKRALFQADYRVQSPSGGYRSVIARGKPEYDSEGKVLRLPGVVIDVTRQKQIETALTASQERYRTLFNSIDEGFCLIEVLFDQEDKPIDYRFLETNPAFEKHTGLSNAEGRTIKQLSPVQETHWLDIYGQVALTGEPIHSINKSSSLDRWYEVRALRFGDAENRQVAILFNDITDRKNIDDNLHRAVADLAEANRRQTEFLATLAHELRNPLAPIRTGLEVMRMSAGKPETLSRVQDMMQRQVSAMTRLIDDLLDIARINSGKLVLQKEVIDLKAVIANAVETTLPHIEAAQHALIQDIPAEALPVYADAVRMTQVFGNLLTNAAKYTPANGRITLSVVRQGRQVDVTISDTGIGIPAASLNKVFDMFTQVGRHSDVAQGGLGIGLSLVRQLVQMHGGTVSVSSLGSGHGSSFTVQLPLQEDAVSAHARKTISSPIETKGSAYRILVADDNRDAAEILTVLLQMQGHVTQTVYDGDQALRAAADFHPDIAFLDIGMPGTDGLQTARNMRKTPGMEDIVLVALTGWATEEDRARSHAAGFNYHLAKPVSIESLNALLANPLQFTDS